MLGTAFEPEFSVAARLLQTVEMIAALRERIAAATVQVAWIPALQKDARVRNTHRAQSFGVPSIRFPFPAPRLRRSSEAHDFLGSVSFATERAWDVIKLTTNRDAQHRRYKSNKYRASV